MSGCPDLSRYYVNGYGQFCIEIIPAGYPPCYFRIDGIDDETLEFILVAI